MKNFKKLKKKQQYKLIYLTINYAKKMINIKKKFFIILSNIMK